LGALRGWAADANGTVTAREAVHYARKALTVLEPKLGRTQTPEGVGGDSSLELAHGARESGPSLSAFVAKAARAPAPGVKAAGFGEGGGALGKVPTVSDVGAPDLGSFKNLDVEALEKLQLAKHA